MPAERMNEEVDGSHLKDDSTHGGYCALAAESFWSALSGLFSSFFLFSIYLIRIQLLPQ